VATALQPDLAERWAARDVAAFRRQVATGLRTTAAIVVPAAVGYLLLGRPIVEVALQHGALSEASARTTASVLGWLALGLPAFSLWYFVIRVYQAMQDTRTVFVLYVVENAVNVGLALALYPSMGVQGLALSYSAAYGVGVVVALVDLRRRVGGLEGTAVARSWARTAVASAAMAACVLGVAVAVGPALPKVTLAVVAGLASYLAVGRALGMAELRALANLRRG
jgi:putative peptidoglycan lipid II flippase